MGQILALREYFCDAVVQDLGTKPHHCAFNIDSVVFFSYLSALDSLIRRNQAQTCYQSGNSVRTD
jgi:hypothetical protein